MRYRENMPPSPRDELFSLPPLARSRARQWARTAWALAFLFASAPVVCKLFLGVWGFEGAAEIGLISFFVGTYLHFAGRRKFRALPDSAALLDRALRLGWNGQLDSAIAVLDGAIRLSPRLWQAFQYRGQMRALAGSFERAVADFDEAIRLAPDEPHLYALRNRAQMLRDQSETAAPARGSSQP